MPVGSQQPSEAVQPQQQQQQQPNGNSGGYWSDNGPRDIGDLNIAPGIAGGGYYIPGPLSQPQQQQTMPQIDTSDPINSLAGMLVTPAEREAQQQRMLRNKRRMIAWTGLFDGLRNLGNLYSVSKGAAPQRYTDNPYQTIERSFNEEQGDQDALFKHRDDYARQLWNLQRQANDDARRNALSAAQARYYDTRDEAEQQKAELAKQKAELDKLKAVRVIKNKDGSLMKFDPVTGNIEALSEADPLYVAHMKAITDATNKRAGLMGAPVTTTTTNAKGETTTSVRSYGSGNSGKSSNGNYSKYRIQSGSGSSGKSKYAKYKTNK